MGAEVEIKWDRTEKEIYINDGSTKGTLVPKEIQISLMKYFA